MSGHTYRFDIFIYLAIIYFSLLVIQILNEFDVLVKIYIYYMLPWTDSTVKTSVFV